jgi:hypothetical protein
MRVLALMFLSIATSPAQTPLASLVGTAKTIKRDQITVQTGAGSILLYTDGDTKVWRGHRGNVLTFVRPGDKIWVRYRQDSARPVIVDLYANVTHVWGRISAVTEGKFEVEQNFNADPQSAYQRRTRQITFNADTAFEESASQDLRVGRTVDIIGLETMESRVQATRVTVYDGDAPVGMPSGARVISPDGSVHTRK